MLPAAAPVGETQGFDPVWQTWPKLALPLAMPFTLHVTVVSEVFTTVGVNVARWPTVRVAAGGDTLTLTALVTVTVAAAVGPVTGTVAWIVTGFVAGKSVGAVYSAVACPVDAIVPTLGFPPTTPFTSQVMAEPAARQNDAKKVCV